MSTYFKPAVKLPLQEIKDKIKDIEVIIEDDEHPLKLVLAKEIIGDIPELTDCQDKDEAKKLRSRYNRWFNNHLVLVETVAHETITKRYTSQNPATSKGRE